MREKNNKKQVIKITVFITSIFVILLSVTYAFINLTLEGTRRQVITSGNISLELDEDENNLTINNALPMYDEVGMLEDAFTFRLINNTSRLTDYVVKLEDITTGEKLDTNIVKYGLTKDGVNNIDLLSNLNNGVIDSGTIGTKQIEYELRLWIDSSVTDNDVIKNKSLSYRIVVEVSQPNEYLIAFDTNGGNTIDRMPFIIDSTYNNLPTPTKTNYEFQGWYTIEGTQVTNESIVNNITNDTLYAKWKNTY